MSEARISPDRNGVSVIPGNYFTYRFSDVDLDRILTMEWESGIGIPEESRAALYERHEVGTKLVAILDGRGSPDTILGIARLEKEGLSLDVVPGDVLNREPSTLINEARRSSVRMTLQEVLQASPTQRTFLALGSRSAAAAGAGVKDGAISFGNVVNALRSAIDQDTRQVSFSRGVNGGVRPV